MFHTSIKSQRASAMPLWVLDFCTSRGFMHVSFHTFRHWLVFCSLSWGSIFLMRHSNNSRLLAQSCSTSGCTCWQETVFVHTSARGQLEWVSFADRQQTRLFTILNQAGKNPGCFMLQGATQLITHHMSSCLSHTFRIKDPNSGGSGIKLY